MAFTKTPENSTYSTKIVRLVKELNNRGTDTSKDEDYFNVIPELIKNKNTKEDEINLIKREGSTSFISSVAAENTRGIFFWESQNQLFVAVNTAIRIYNATTGSLLTTIAVAFSTTTGEVGFCEFLYDTGTVKVVCTDGTSLMTIDSAGAVVVGVDADMPVHLPYPVFLDGYLFIIKAGTADLYNSNLNDPLAYTPGDFITAEMIPDTAVWLSRLNNYLVVGGNQSIEYFWDAAVASGSPLQRNDTPVKLAGLMGGMATIGNKIYLIANHNTSTPDVFELDDFKMKPVGNEAVRRHLKSLTISNLTSIRGSCISRYVLDLESKLWTRFGFQTNDNFAFIHMISSETTGGYTTFFSISGTSVIYKTSNSLYQDDGTTFPIVIITGPEEFDTFRQKTMSRLTIWADAPTASSTGTLQWTDDDYQSFSTGLTFDLFHERPCVNRLGRFRQRAFKLTYTQNQPFRIESFEVEINKGIH
jgi:hypothetical protein